jgi:hypothetical protein
VLPFARTCPRLPVQEGGTVTVAARSSKLKVSGMFVAPEFT